MRRYLKKKRLILVAVFLGGIVVIVLSVYTYMKIHDPGGTLDKDVREIVGKVKQLALVPDEDPTIATIEDKTKVNQGGVLRDAENGDKVLLFYEAGVAIVYRPSLNRVVAIGPLVVDASAEQVKDSVIEIRNGTNNQGRYKRYVSLLRERYKQATIRESEANRIDYPQTIVIDLTDANSKFEFIGAMTELLDGQRGVLPLAETRPDADILVIVGKD